MKKLNRSTANLDATLPVKVVQFGEGNFLRAFADWMIQKLNDEISYNAGVAVVQPIENGMVDMLDDQDGLYHHLMRGISGGNIVNESRLISCIQQCVNPFNDQKAFFELAVEKELELIISNTTEAGIVFQNEDVPDKGKLAITFPGKLTQFLFYRYQHLNEIESKTLAIIPCELIDRNGDKLRAAILNYIGLWSLPVEFQRWIEESVSFGNTLVDRIVPGFPRDEIKQIQQDLGFEDNLVVASESFHLWVIEGPKALEDIFPASKSGLNVKFVEDLTPYRTRKVRILNGAHTTMIPIGLLYGLETVKETVEDEFMGDFVKKVIFNEIVPTIDLPREELEEFANNVIERFQNPFIRHELKSIALNSMSKFKVRVLPVIEDYINKTGEAPELLCLGFAGLIRFYMEGMQGKHSFLNDDANVLEFYSGLDPESSPENLVKMVLGNEDFWSRSLTNKDLLVQSVTRSLELIIENGAQKTIKELNHVTGNYN
ncbi:tagaturonate reductase [Marinigracilibium pacificum]|uniref:Tagaturonate reductase n=1 Tax=Marinigracilibium pacificum TaxID=2729599 RepID=A0A848J2X9_9BACT|nr:tagaturonate reductase [Marinigracilibium pacificum]NMM49688.1 tagaturonate reductase [Marinigracilibium pacificum]